MNRNHMAVRELAHHQMFPEDGDPSWYANRLPDDRSVRVASMSCNPDGIHWEGSVKDPNACECDGTCNLCLIRADGGLIPTGVMGFYRSANSAV